MVVVVVVVVSGLPSVHGAKSCGHVSLSKDLYAVHTLSDLWWQGPCVPCSQKRSKQFFWAVVAVVVGDVTAVDVTGVVLVAVAVELTVVDMVIGRQRSKSTGHSPPTSPAQRPASTRLWHSPDVPNLHTLSRHWKGAAVLATVVVVVVLVVSTATPWRHATKPRPQVSLFGSSPT